MILALIELVYDPLHVYMSIHILPLLIYLFLNFFIREIFFPLVFKSHIDLFCYKPIHIINTLKEYMFCSLEDLLFSGALLPLHSLTLITNEIQGNHVELFV